MSSSYRSSYRRSELLSWEGTLVWTQYSARVVGTLTPSRSASAAVDSTCFLRDSDKACDDSVNETDRNGRRPGALPDDLCVLLVFAFAVPPFAEHDGRVHVGRGEGVGLIEQRDHAEEDRPDDDTNEDTQIGSRRSEWLHAESRGKELENVFCAHHLASRSNTSILHQSTINIQWSQWTAVLTHQCIHGNAPAYRKKTSLPRMHLTKNVLYYRVLRLKKRTLWGRTNLTFWVGFHLSEGSSPLWGSSTGGCRMEMHTSPFWKSQGSSVFSVCIMTKLPLWTCSASRYCWSVLREQLLPRRCWDATSWWESGRLVANTDSPPGIWCEPETRQ